MTEKPPLSSASWTGLPEETPAQAFARQFRPPESMATQHKAAMTALLFVAGIALFFGWSFILGLSSPATPSAETGQTQYWTFGRGGPAFYVTRVEAGIGLALISISLLGPAGFLGWTAWRERRRA
ncbi:hypothetical protein [Teichococcus deserti]|nr:hypothetical protein [Pseudoroseomonas deserti]